MKRKIKFRGKDVRTSHWVYGAFHEHIDITPAAFYKNSESRENHIKEHTHHLIIQDAFSDYCMPRNIQCFEVTSETVGQFTGFTDCVTREIYEDDILHFERYGKNYTALVKWNDEVGAWCMQLRYEPRCGCRPLSEWLNEECLEVIGNIHDNPELFRKQNQ